MANIGLLIAGGSGNRMHQDIPKQFITVHERPVIVYTLEAFQNHPEIDAIAVVCIEGWEQVLWAYAKQFNITKLKYVVPGGKNGQDSINQPYCRSRKDQFCCQSNGTKPQKQPVHPPIGGTKPQTISFLQRPENLHPLIIQQVQRQMG